MLPNAQIGFGMRGKPKEKDRRDSGVSESVQLPSIGGAPSAAGDDAPSHQPPMRDDAMPNAADYIDPLLSSSSGGRACPQAARIASHQGVLENQSPLRGRGERREKNDREDTRERSRRTERAREKEDSRRVAARSAEADPKKPKLEHGNQQDEKQDELMNATQQDEEEANLPKDEETKDSSAGLGPYKQFENGPSHERIIAPTPTLAPAPLTHLMQQQQLHAVAPRSLIYLIPWLHCIRSRTVHMWMYWSLAQRLRVKAFVLTRLRPV